MINTEKQNVETSVVDEVMALQENDLEQLKVIAEERGVTLEDTVGKAEAIETIAKVMVESAETAEEFGGQNFAILVNYDGDEERTKAGHALMQAARAKITQNQAAKKYFQLFLTNRDGGVYTVRRPGTTLKQSTLDKIIPFVKLTNNGSQDDMWNEFQASPENFEDPILILQPHRHADGSYRRYVMLHLTKKNQAKETVF